MGYSCRFLCICSDSSFIADIRPVRWLTAASAQQQACPCFISKGHDASPRHCPSVGLSGLSPLSSSEYLISSISPAASWIWCQALHCPHWTKTRPLSHAIGLTILLVVPSAWKHRHRHGGTSDAKHALTLFALQVLYGTHSNALLMQSCCPCTSCF